MNKKILFSLIGLLVTFYYGMAQDIVSKESQSANVEQQMSQQVQDNTQQQAQQPIQIRYGKISYNDILKNMPEFKAAKNHMIQLRRKFEKEANYNESSFKRMFAEFLQGQKDFPQNIMLKRQRDLQDAMEKSLAFRQEADSLLHAAEVDLQKPLRARLDSAIFLVGAQRGYECIFNTDTNSVPFLHPMITEDATPYVLEKLNALKP